MKKILSMVIMVLLIGVQTACAGSTMSSNNKEMANYENSENITFNSENNKNTTIDSVKSLTERNIVVRGTKELNQMREMLSNKSEYEFEEYRKTLIGTYTDREDLFAFVQLVDTLPYVELTEAGITRIEYSVDEETDIEKVRILIKEKSGRMACFDYLLSVKDFKNQLNKMDFGDNTLMRFDSEESVQSKDGKLKILAESKRPHAAGAGTVTEWYAEANEIFIKISYFDKGNQDVKISELILNKEVTEFSKIAAMEQGR